MSNNTQAKDANQLKVFNSPIYRQKIKRMVEMTKTIYGIHGKIPKGSLPKLKENATERERIARAEQENYRLTIDTLHYFATPIAGASYASKQEKAAPETDNTDTTQTA